MPKVLHLYKDIFPPVYGGIEVVLGKLATHQVRKGWEAAVAVSGPVDREWSEKTGVEALPVGEWGRALSNPISTGFLKVLRKEEYDALHLHLPCPTVVISTLLAGRRDVPWFASYQSDIVRQKLTGAVYTPIDLRFLSRCAGIFVSSPPLLETSPVLQRVRDRCRVVPLGISAERLSKEDREEGKRIRSEHPDRPIILFVGRFRWYKGLNVLLEAMDRVDATLLVVGSGTSAQVRETRRIAAGLKHPDRVRFLGSVARLEPLLAAGDLFCLPSTHRAEAFGYVLLEAFRAGLPAVTTELGTGTSYVNQDGVTGYVARPQDPAALAEALNRAIIDPIHLRELGIAARKRVEQEFGLDRMVDDILDSYNRCLAGKGE